MSKMFVYWAQALDNASPDHLDVQGVRLAPEDAVRRQAAVSLVSSVVKTGSRIFSEHGVWLTENGHQFVVEVPSAEADQAGRMAPIDCYGEYEAEADDAFGAAVSDGIENFARSIGRTIRPDQAETIRRAFEARKKKSSRNRLVLLAGIGLLALAVLAGVLALTLRRW